MEMSDAKRQQRREIMSHNTFDLVSAPFEKMNQHEMLQRPTTTIRIDDEQHRMEFSNGEESPSGPPPPSHIRGRKMLPPRKRSQQRSRQMHQKALTRQFDATSAYYNEIEYQLNNLHGAGDVRRGKALRRKRLRKYYKD